MRGELRHLDGELKRSSCLLEGISVGSRGFLKGDYSTNGVVTNALLLIGLFIAVEAE